SGPPCPAPACSRTASRNARQRAPLACTRSAASGALIGASFACITGLVSGGIARPGIFFGRRIGRHAAVAPGPVLAPAGHGARPALFKPTVDHRAGGLDEAATACD